MVKCDIPKGQVNRKVARLNALVTLALSIIYILTFQVWIIYVITADFLIKGFIAPKFSPISKINVLILKVLKIKPDPIFAPPKIFASKIGFVFSLTIGILHILDYSTAAVVVVSVLAFFAFLESAFEICVGCWMHSYWLKMCGKCER